jgi:Ni/Co efflux regulator RcnB
MKLIHRLLIALTLLGTTSVALADRGPRDHDRRSQGHGDRHDNRDRRDDRRHDSRRYGYSHARPVYRHARWERGRHYYGPNYVVRDYRHYRLRPPPRGYHWVRANNDYLLVAVATGVILDIALHH